MATIAELLLARGRSEADAIRQRGDSSAQMWTNLGGLAANALTSYAQQKEQEPIRKQTERITALKVEEAEAEAKARRAAQEADGRFSTYLQDWDGKPETLHKAATLSYGPEVGTKKAKEIWDGFKALHGDPRKDFADTQSFLKPILQGMNALPEDVRARIYPDVRKSLVERGAITEQDAPPEYQPEWWQSTVSYGQEPLNPVAVEGVGPDGQPQTQFVVPEPGKTVDKPAPKLSMVEQASAALKAGNPNEYARIMRVLRDTAAAQQAPERPTKPDYEWVNRPGADGTMIAVQIPKGTAQPGDTPYSPPRSTSETAQDRQRKGRLDSARGFLTRLNELRTKINTKMGPEAGLTGMARQGMASIGLDPDVAEYERIRAAGGRALAVAIMGAQNLSDADAAAWSNMLPGARIDEETAKRLTTQIGKMLEDTDTEPSNTTPNGNRVYYDENGNPK